MTEEPWPRPGAWSPLSEESLRKRHRDAGSQRDGREGEIRNRPLTQNRNRSQFLRIAQRTLFAIRAIQTQVEAAPKGQTDGVGNEGEETGENRRSRAWCRATLGTPCSTAEPKRSASRGFSEKPQEQGTVRVNIAVDWTRQSHQVRRPPITSAVTTLTDSYHVEFGHARLTAKTALFDADPMKPRRTGYITIRFDLEATRPMRGCRSRPVHPTAHVSAAGSCRLQGELECDQIGVLALGRILQMGCGLSMGRPAARETVCHMVAAVLQEAGHRVGLFTAPLGGFSRAHPCQWRLHS